MNKSLNGLLYSRKFWLAIFGLIASLVFYFLPAFPVEIWIAVEVLVTVLIASIAVEDAGSKIGKGG